MDKISFSPIGIIHTPYTEQDNTPIQGCFATASEGTVEIFPEFAAGLRNIEGFSHLFLIYHFHRADGFNLIAKPFLDKDEKGIFAIRYFARPNAIGLSVVRLLEVEGNRLRIGEVDMLDGTPLLDIKPYVAQFDVRQNTACGWYKTASEAASFTKKGSPK